MNKRPGKKKGPGRPKETDPKILFPSFRMLESEVKAIQGKAKESGQKLGELVSQKLKELI